MFTPVTYTPDQVARILQLSTNTVYDLIKKGEIIAKRFGKVYRIPSSSLSFAMTGLDYDIYLMEQEDNKHLPQINQIISDIRANRWKKSNRSSSTRT